MKPEPSNQKSYTYGKQTIEQDDINAVAEILKGDWLTQGPAIQKFEEALAQKFNASYVAAVANGTAALHLAALALEWGKNDIVITTPITFVASANCILYAGAVPDFADIDPVTYTINIDKLEEKIKKYRAEGKNIKAVVAVDFAGHPCDWKSLKQLSETYNFTLINDNCHAPGAEVDGDAGYAAKYAGLVVQSYHPVKHITTGEGGAVLTNNKELDQKIKILRTHGITKPDPDNPANPGPWYYEMHTLGFNYRITDFQAALGSMQLKKLDAFIKKRREIAEYYDNAFKDDERFITPSVNPGVKHAYHLYPLQVKFEELKITKVELFNKLKENKINLQVHYIPVHLQPYYRNNFGFKEGDFPEAEKFYSREISIPMYPSLTNEDLEYIVKTIKSLAE